jgi:hypothetical protein
MRERPSRQIGQGSQTSLRNADRFRKIADDLNVARVQTAHGGARWYAATVRQVLLRTS